MIRIISCLVMAAVLSIPLSARVLNVPGEYTTIQAGIDASSDGDTVLVAPGEYLEHINFNGKRITLTSVAGPEQTVISKAYDGYPLVVIQNGEDSTTVISGFTIIGSTQRGIICGYASPVIENNFIENNTSPYNHGAGIYCLGSAATIRNNRFINNSSYRAGSGNKGGAIAVDACSTLSIVNNIFISNNTSGGGGAIWCVSAAECLIERNLLDNNSTSTGGGGVYLEGCRNLQVINNDILNSNSGGNGGGIYLLNATEVSIINNILYQNDNYGIYSYAEFSGTIDYNCFFENNLGPTYNLIPGAENIQSDPAFLDPFNFDYHLTENSPCIDSGDPSTPGDPDHTRADIGFYYFDQGIRIYDFHLLAPPGRSVFSTVMPTLIWQGTSDSDSCGQVFFNAVWDSDSLFASPESSGLLIDTSYVIFPELERSRNYFWRIWAANDHAAPLPSQETWSFYVDGYPSIPEIFAPLNGADADSATVLAWYASSDPDSFDIVSYSIQIDDDSSFNSPEIDQSGLRSDLLLDDAFAISLAELAGYSNLQNDTRYLWRVKADDNYGLSSNWTDGTNWFYFMAGNHAPFPPLTGFSPANGEEVISLTPLMTWNIARDPDPPDDGDNLSYAMRLSADSAFSGMVCCDTTAPGINQISPSSDLNDNSHYFYQIMTVDDDGLASDWSATQDFWTNHRNVPPDPFYLFSPVDSALQITYNTDFTWGNTIDSDPLSNFTFALQYSADSTFVNNPRTIAGLTDTSFSLPTDSLMLMGRNIYWRVLAIDDDSLVRVGGLPDAETRMIFITITGDANHSGAMNGVDVIYLMTFLAYGGPAPQPLLAGDVNNDCDVNFLDLTFMVNFFAGFGNHPQRGDCR